MLRYVLAIYLLMILLLGAAMVIGLLGRERASDRRRRWHPSKIICPDDRWTPQNGYILQRIEGPNGESCTDLTRGLPYTP